MMKPERRRVFWGAFAIDSHGAISTGWPSLMDPDEVGTASGRERSL